MHPRTSHALPSVVSPAQLPLWISIASRRGTSSTWYRSRPKCFEDISRQGYTPTGMQDFSGQLSLHGNSSVLQFQPSTLTVNVPGVPSSEDSERCRSTSLT